MTARHSWRAAGAFPLLMLITAACDREPGTTQEPHRHGTRTAMRHCADIAMMSRCLDTQRDEISEDACLLSVSYQAQAAAGGCPAEGRVAACQTRGGILHYYGQGGQPYTPERAREQCKSLHDGRLAQP